MLLVRCNKARLEYDIHSLVKAFFPEQDVKVLTPESVVKDKSILEQHSDIEMTFEETQIRCLIRCGLHKNEELVESFCYKSDVTGDNSLHNDIEETEFVWNISEKMPDFKNQFKLALYEALSEYTGKKLPWGNLTGIRPTKIAMTMLEEGKAEADIVEFLKTVHQTSDEKIALSIDIAKREKALLDTIHYENGYSVYIGIPFCPTTCLYCSFTSFPIAAWRKRVGEYLEAVAKELDYIATEHADKIIDTIYIGGGTPTSLDADALEQLLHKITVTLDLSHIKEFTVEAGRADSITREKLEVLKKYGVTRISVNPQTMKQVTLDMIGRRHTVEQVKDTYKLAKEIGFENINMDIILGLPGENEEDVQNTIEEIKKLNPDSLTVHSLAIKRASKLSNWIIENGISTLNNTDTTMEIARQGALDMKMNPYYLYRQKNMSGNFENVGYAREGKYGLYNILIMEEVQTIIACGAGTITKRVYPDGRIERCDNVKDVALYIDKIDEMIERKRNLFSTIEC